MLVIICITVPEVPRVCAVEHQMSVQLDMQIEEPHPLAQRSKHCKKNNNFLPTEREGRTGEYWPEVVAVRTERSEVRTKTTEGQYSSVRSRASEVSK